MPNQNVQRPQGNLGNTQIKSPCAGNFRNKYSKTGTFARSGWLTFTETGISAGKEQGESGIEADLIFVVRYG
jgi:hypothetical protein